MLATSLGLAPTMARIEVCGALLVRPNPDNWSEYPNVSREVDDLVAGAAWHRVYDIAERFYDKLSSIDSDKGQEFQTRLNEFFHEHGVGWEMIEGRIVARGSEIFGQVSTTAVDALNATGRKTSAQEIHEALRDLSRRPHADVTGAIQHAMAALECVARDVTNQQTKTLGQLIPILDLPKPLDIAIEKLWGFASEQGRHIREGRKPRFEDAELVVTVAAAVSSYLSNAGQKETTK